MINVILEYEGISMNTSGSKQTTEKNWGSNSVRVLKMTIDSDLNFEKHFPELCKNTKKKISTLIMLGKYISVLKRESYL